MGLFVIDKNGKKQKFDSISKVCEKLNLTLSIVSRRLRGNGITHKGYTFELCQ